MSIGRISTNYAFLRSMANISDTFQHISKLQEKLNTGKEVNRPSDDPVGMQKIYSLTASLRENEQYQENIDRGLGRLNATSVTLGQVEDLLINLSELATTAGSSATTSAERGAFAQEVELLIEQVVNLANSTHQGKFLFGGINTMSGTCPLSFPYNIQYDSNGLISGVVPNPRGINTLIETTIMHNVREEMNISGAAPFQPNGYKGAGDIFNTLVQFRQNLTTNDLNALTQSELDIKAALEQVTTQDIIVGARLNRFETTKSTLKLLNISETEEKSRIEDADFAKLLLDMSIAELSLNSTLSSTATLLQNSLLNFI